MAARRDHRGLEGLAETVRRAPGLRSLTPLWNFTRPAYERILRWLSGGRGLLRQPVPGVTLRVVYQSRQLIRDDYEPETFAFLRHAVRPGMTIVDVGAGHGVYSMVFSRWVGPVGKILACEPNPHHYAVLLHNLALNGCDNVKPLPVALGERIGPAQIYCSGSGADSLVPRRDKDVEPVPVRMTTLDALCAEHKLQPGLIKIDVEGYELHVLKGLTATLAANPACTVVCELHPEVWPQAGYGVDDLKATIATLGCRAFSMDGTPYGFSSIGHYQRIALRAPETRV